MPNPQKVARVERISDDLKSANSLVLSDFSGINVEEISELRRRCRESGVRFRVVKNTLISRAVQGTEMEGLDEYFEGPTAVAFSDDMVAPAKVLKEFFKDYEKLEIKAGFVDGQVIDRAGVQTLADLPGREQLLTQFATGINAPLSMFARVLNASLNGLVTALDQLAKKKAAA